MYNKCTTIQKSWDCNFVSIFIEISTFFQEGCIIFIKIDSNIYNKLLQNAFISVNYVLVYFLFIEKSITVSLKILIRTTVF